MRSHLDKKHQLARHVSRIRFYLGCNTTSDDFRMPSDGVGPIVKAALCSIDDFIHCSDLELRHTKSRIAASSSFHHSCYVHLNRVVRCMTGLQVLKSSPIKTYLVLPSCKMIVKANLLRLNRKSKIRAALVW